MTPFGFQARRRRHRTRGQSLVEFSLMLPALMLILVMGLDLGRVFLGWVALNNVARIAANYGAQNPSTWTASGSTIRQSEYQTLLANDLSGINCEAASPYPVPSFPSGHAPGDLVTVRLECNFSLITPLVGSIVGNPLHVSASAAFPIRAGQLPGGSITPVLPAPSATASATAGPSATVGSSSPPTASPTASPVPVCLVPNLVGSSTNQVQHLWAHANFTTNVLFSPLAGGHDGNYTVVSQSSAANSFQPCDTTVITVYGSTQ